MNEPAEVHRAQNDREALCAMRDKLTRELYKLALVEADSSEPIWNNNPVIGFIDGPNTTNFPALRAQRIGETFVARPPPAYMR